MNKPFSKISRRSVISGSLALAGCAEANDYFGATQPPNEQRLTYLIGGEPETLDPAKTPGGFAEFVLPALFEGLTGYHPQTLEPMAALATHYEVSSNELHFTFFLRGHPAPRGIKLPNTDTLRAEFLEGRLPQDYSRGKCAPEDSMPARWSDGTIITAHDFVESWRRVADPITVAPKGFVLYCVLNAEAIATGRCDPAQLGVTVIDAFTFKVDLRGPTPFFLRLTSNPVLLATPTHTIQSHKDAWTEPGRIVTGGAFLLAEHIAHHKIVLSPNPYYYESQLVKLKRLTFIPVAAGSTAVNLYKAGSTDAMPGDRLPQEIFPLLGRKKDFHFTAAFMTVYPVMNVTRSPFNHPLVRYSFNMATNKKEIADFFRAGRIPAVNFIPPLPDYHGPHSVPVDIGGKSIDVLSYDPRVARELLAAAGHRKGGSPSIEYLFPTLPHSRPIAEILQQQWRRNLGIDVKLVLQEFRVWLQSTMELNYPGVAEGGYWPSYIDPFPFLEQFVRGSAQNGTGWTSPEFDAALERTNVAPDRGARMQLLAGCEKRLLQAMPVIPLFFYSWVYLQKPFVKGLSANAIDVHPFKYVWIDTNWRPS